MQDQIKISALEEKISVLENKLDRLLVINDRALSINEQLATRFIKYFDKIEKSERRMQHLSTMPLPKIK